MKKGNWVPAVLLSPLCHQLLLAWMTGFPIKFLSSFPLLLLQFLTYFTVTIVIQKTNS